MSDHTVKLTRSDFMLLAMLVEGEQRLPRTGLSPEAIRDTAAKISHVSDPNWGEVIQEVTLTY